MTDVLTALRAAAEPSRLRILALAATGAFCVAEFVDILGQSQPRLSRHLRLLHDAGLLERSQEGANVWFTLRQGLHGRLIRDVLAHLPAADPTLQADRRQALRVVAERARVATEAFRRSGAEWDEMRALGLPAERVEAALAQLLPDRVPRLLDIGTGTGRLLELFGPRCDAAVGLDASRTMLALARARLGQAGLGHCTVRLGDMERLPFEDGCFDAAVLHMVLHHADDPARALAEAARVLRPGGALVVADLAPHHDEAAMRRHKHRWPGFATGLVTEWFEQAGLSARIATTIPGALEIVLVSGVRPRVAAQRQAELVA